MSESHLQGATQNFRKRIRDLCDKADQDLTARQVLNLFLDVYELFMIQAEDQDVRPALPFFSSPDVLRVSADEFDEIVKSKKQKDAAKISTKAKEEPGGQYL